MPRPGRVRSAILCAVRHELTQAYSSLSPSTGSTDDARRAVSQEARNRQGRRYRSPGQWVRRLHRKQETGERLLRHEGHRSLRP